MSEPQLNEKLWPPDIRRAYWQYLEAEKILPKQQKYYNIRIWQFIEESGVNDF